MSIILALVGWACIFLSLMFWIGGDHALAYVAIIISILLNALAILVWTFERRN
jgi:hypothetical protein